MEKFFSKEIDLYFSALLLIGITAIIVFQIITRFLNIPFPWPDEIARFLNIWMAFILLGRAAKMDTHVRIDFFINKTPKIIWYIINNLANLLNSFVAIFIIVSAMKYMQQVWTVKSSAASIPVPLYFFAVIIGMAIMAVVYTINFYQGVKKYKA